MVMKNIFTSPAFYWLIASVFFFALGEYYSKKWAFKPGIALGVYAVGMYSIGSLLWLPALLQHNQIVVMGRIWLLMATAGSMLVGLIAFREHLTPVQWTGVACSLKALALLSA